VMYEIMNAAGEKRAIIQGFVTEHIADIQRVRGPDSSGRLKPTRYVQFTSNEGELITGLEIAPGEARRILAFYKKAVRTEITPEDAYSDLLAGDKVPVHGPAGEQWLLHPRRDGRIQIMGATLAKHQDVLRPLGVVAYDQPGNFLFLKGRGEEELPASLRTFLERFPPVVETQVVDDVDDAEGALAEAGVEYDPTDESVPATAAAPSARELALPFYSRLELAVLRAP